MTHCITSVARDVNRTSKKKVVMGMNKKFLLKEYKKLQGVNAKMQTLIRLMDERQELADKLINELENELVLHKEQSDWYKKEVELYQREAETYIKMLECFQEHFEKANGNAESTRESEDSIDTDYGEDIPY